jgi:hypothetical protein
MTKRFLTGFLLATTLALAAIPSTPQEAIAQIRDFTAPKLPAVWCRDLRRVTKAPPTCAKGWVAKCDGEETKCRLTLQRQSTICVNYLGCFPRW